MLLRIMRNFNICLGQVEIEKCGKIRRVEIWYESIQKVLSLGFFRSEIFIIDIFSKTIFLQHICT